MAQDPVHVLSTDPVLRPLSAAHGCAYAKTPHPAFWLVTGCFGTSNEVPPAGFEPAHTAPEAVALSPELRGRVTFWLAATGRTLPACGGCACTGDWGSFVGWRAGVLPRSDWMHAAEGESSLGRGRSGKNADATKGARLGFIRAFRRA